VLARGTDGGERRAGGRVAAAISQAGMDQRVSGQQPCCQVPGRAVIDHGEQLANSGNVTQIVGGADSDVHAQRICSWLIPVLSEWARGARAWPSTSVGRWPAVCPPPRLSSASTTPWRSRTSAMSSLAVLVDLVTRPAAERSVEGRGAWQPRRRRDPVRPPTRTARRPVAGTAGAVELSGGATRFRASAPGSATCAAVRSKTTMSLLAARRSSAWPSRAGRRAIQRSRRPQNGREPPLRRRKKTASCRIGTGPGTGRGAVTRRAGPCRDPWRTGSRPPPRSSR
jgi:hypothetical protein